MDEGFWINYDKSKVFPVSEHEVWIRNPKNAKKLGLSCSLTDEFDKFKEYKDRDKFLTYIMSKAPIMRVRGHGTYWTFEFNTGKTDDVLFEIYKFCKDIAGDYTGLYIVNLKNKDVIDVLYKDFKEKMSNGDTESLLKVARKNRKK